MQEQILPGKEKQDEIWSIIEKKADGRQRRFNHWYIASRAGSIVAAIFVCILCLPQTGFADGIKSFLDQYFDKPASIKQDIVENIYEDSDGHIKMQITKMFSDGACAYLDICYEALDDIGKDWLSNVKMEVDSIGFLYKGDIIGKTTAYRQALQEYKDMATGQARYFSFSYVDYSGNFNLNRIKRILSYPMCKGKREEKMKLNSNIDTFAYHLEGEKPLSKFYEPEYLLVSKFSYGIFGKNQGVYTGLSNGGYLNEDFLSSPDSDIEKVVFIMNDGSKIKIDDMAEFCPALDVPGYDLVVASGFFYNEDGSRWNMHKAINPTELDGVQINGTYYNLVLDESYK